MNASLRYDFVAEAFRIETGFMAPGKSAPIGDNTPFKYRESARKEWTDKNSEIIRAFELAAAKILCEEPA